MKKQWKPKMLFQQVPGRQQQSDDDWPIDTGSVGFGTCFIKKMD